MENKTTKLIMREKPAKLFLSLNGCSISDACRKAGFKGYAHAWKIAQQFLTEGYFRKEDSRKFIITFEGASLAEEIKKILEGKNAD